jgi:hypothetical protein
MNPLNSMTTRTTRRFGWLLFLPLLAGCESTGAGGMSPLGGPPAEDEDMWAIRCLTLQGSNRIQLAENYANSIKQVKALKSDLVRVIHEAEETSVFYGRYQRQYDAKTGEERYAPDPMRDLEFIRSLSMDIQDPATGRRTVWPFQLATMSTLPGGRGTHPEWLLDRAPGYYSLQIAVFYNTGDMRQRKFAAEEYCKLLREQGEEAYYFNGPVNSIVCVGAFPKEAIQTVQKADPLTGIIQVKSVMVDPRLLELQKKYPHNTHNGSVFYEITQDPKTGEKIRDPHTSFAVEVPRKSDRKNSLTGEP